MAYSPPYTLIIPQIHEYVNVMNDILIQIPENPRKYRMFRVFISVF